MTRTWDRLVAQVAATVALLCTSGCYLFGPRNVPTGQPPLAYLSQGTLDDLRAAFNAASDRTRLLLLFSPT
jgi:hypothetical protein